MDSKRPVFDAGGYLNSQGLKFQGVSESGDHQFQTPQGEVVSLDVKGYLKSKGVPADKLALEFNTPDAPLDSSPVGMWDRVKLALGNNKGGVKYLKSKFEDAAFSEDHGLMVKDKGVWQKVDKSATASWSDPWELTRDIVEGGVSILPSAAASAKGAAVGLAAGPVGAIVGAGVGGATAGAATRGILGRLAGTYEATPEEELKDVGLDFLLNAGGQGLALGAKPTLQAFGTAVKNIVKATKVDKAAAGTIDVMADVLGRTTGAGSVRMRTVFDQTDDVMRALQKSKVGAASEHDMILNLKRNSLRKVGAIVSEAPKALSRKFGALVDDLSASVGDDFVVNVGQTIKDTQNDLVEAGLGKWVTESAKPASASVAAIGESLEQATKAPGKRVFQLLSDDEIAKRVTLGKPGQMLDDATKESIGKVVSAFQKYEKIGPLKGKAAAKALMEIKRNVNATFDDIIDSGASPSVERVITQLREGFGTRLGQHFHKAGVADKYTATSQLYAKYGDAVRVARRTLRAENGEEVLLNKLTQGVGAQQTYKDLTGDLAELLGTEGQQWFKGIAVNDAASAMAQKLPKVTFGFLGAAGAGAAVGVGAVSAPVAGLGMVQMSPRLVLNEIKYAKAGLDFIKSLPNSSKVQWLQNPNLVRETFKATMDAAIGEDQLKEELLRQGGVKQ
jgi:hypothetical protein